MLKKIKANVRPTMSDRTSVGFRKKTSPGQSSCPKPACDHDHSKRSVSAPEGPYFFAFFFFDFLKPTLPALGSYGRWASCIWFVELALSTGESVTAVEPAALAGSDRTTRPAAARSILRKFEFMIGILP